MKARSHKPGSACKYLNDKVVINKDNNYFFKIFILFIFKYFTYLFFREGKGERREGEKHQCVVASSMSPTGNLACNPGMCLDWESNWQPFGSHAGWHSVY